MNIDDLLSRLEGVRRYGDRAIARCPAHPDRTPSLSVQERDGKLLLHCFAGCDALSVVDAVGLSLSDLFTEPPAASGPKPMRLYLSQALRLIEHDSLRALVAAGMVQRGEALSREDLTELARAYARIAAVREAVYG